LMIVFISIIACLCISLKVAWVLAKKFIAMEIRIQQLENAQSKHMPYKAINGIEDAIAVIMDADRMTDEAVTVIQAQQQRINKVQKILGIVRNDPYKYNDNEPAGLREKSKIQER